MKAFVKRGGLLLLGFALVFLGWENIQRVQDSLSPPFVYWKDCNQPYVMGRAILNGDSPYLPLPELGAAFLRGARFANHPTPYPPFVALLGVPMALLDYETAARLWLAGEVACLAGALALLMRAMGWRLGPVEFGVLFAVILVLPPVSDELRQGQFMSGLLLLLCGAWHALRRHHDGVGGVLLGLLVGIKVIAWPILVLLMLMGRGRAVRAALWTLLVIHIVVLPFVGPSGVWDYYFKVGPQNASMWRPAEGNYSAWGWANRLFTGFGFSFTVEPLWRAPRLAAVLTPVFPALCLAAGLWAAKRASRFDTAFALATGVSLLVSPVFWHFYLLFAAIPVVVLGKRLATRGWPASPTFLAALCLGVLSISTDTYGHFARSFGRPVENSRLIVPFGPGTVLLIPVVALLGLLFLTWRTDSEGEEAWRPGSHSDPIAE